MDSTSLIYIGITILLIIIGISDILYRRVKNELMMIFLGISLILFLLSQNISFYSISIIIFTSFIAIILFALKFWGAADGKMLIGSSIFTLSTSYMSFVYFLFNSILLFVVSSIVLSTILLSHKDKKKLFKEVPFYQFFFQVSLILVYLILITPLFIPLILNSLWYAALPLLGIIILNEVSKLIFYKIEENTKIVIIFTALTFSFFHLFENFLISFLVIFAIRTSIHFLSEMSVEGLNKEYHGFAPPIVFYMGFALIIEMFFSNTLIHLLFL